MVNSYRDLIVWQKSMLLVIQVYRKTKTLPGEELYGLVAQIGRSSVSIPYHFLLPLCLSSEWLSLRVANSTGNLPEFMEHISTLVLHLGYLSKEDFEDINEQSREIERMLSSLIKKVGAKK